MIFDHKAGGTGLFEAKTLLDPVVRAHDVKPAPRIPMREPNFLTAPDYFRTSWWSRLGTLLSRYPAHLTSLSATLFRDTPVRPRRFAAWTLGISLLLHACAFMLLPVLLRYLPLRAAPTASTLPVDQQVLYYHLTPPEHRDRAPKILPPGPGSTPGSGSAPTLPPAPGASTSQAAFFAVSHPKVPDNNHQTIIQPLTQPELKMKEDLKLPNLLLAKPVAPKAPLQFNPKSVKPLQHQSQEVVTAAPTINPTNVQQPLTDALTATNDHPKLAVPLGAPPAPNMPSRDNGSSAAVGAPEFEANGAQGQGLLVLGTSPGNPSEMVALPSGNRYGQFSIAPGGNGSGAPGGQPGGSPNGGTGVGSAGGNDSTGVGSGKSGGGGGDSGTPGIVSIRGNGSAESLGNLEPEHVASLVFALPKISGPRHDALMVAAGPMGGGGLDVYGALHCGKIFTVFLPASGKAWTLQFCQTPAAGVQPAAPKVYTSVVHMEQALVPPEAETRFEFKRTPLPPEKLHKYVILKGRLNEEGVVTDLTVYQGLSPEMDAAAKLAFSKWTFKPATKGGKPVGVDILVGVPSDQPRAAAPKGGTSN